MAASRQLRLFSSAGPEPVPAAGHDGAASGPKPRAGIAGPERDRFIATELSAWFVRSARDLPWRAEKRVPYAVWLSEIMLQQTRVETVIPYFERFLSRYPDVRALADAPIDDVLHLWSGLGYYRRARQLHATAREVAARHDGVFPAEAAALRALPGIGAYTAGAISSIAYGKREPLVDGNVARVIARLEGIDESIKSPTTIKRVWEIAARLVPEERPGRFNEALMELGATVCTPRDPRCDTCPLVRACQARASGRERELPVVESKKPVPTVSAVAVVIAGGDGRLLFARRREGGLFGGLWEPPMVEGVSEAAPARPLFTAMGLPLGRIKLREAGKVTHVLTHRRMEITVISAASSRVEPPAEMGPPYEKAAWLDASKPGVGVSTLARKVILAASPEQKD